MIWVKENTQRREEDLEYNLQRFQHVRNGQMKKSLGSRVKGFLSHGLCFLCDREVRSSSEREEMRR